MTPLTPVQRAAYWRRNRNLMMKLMVIWFLVSFIFGILLVDQLNLIRWGGLQAWILVRPTRLYLRVYRAHFLLRASHEET